MTTKTLGAYTHRIRDLHGKHPERVLINVHHIENERRYRQITVADITKALRIGKVVQIRDSEQTIVWEGIVLDGRTIRLFCSLLDADGEETLVIEDTSSLEVASAFQPRIDDDNLKKKWLEENPDYEDAGKRNGVRKKIAVTKV